MVNNCLFILILWGNENLKISYKIKYSFFFFSVFTKISYYKNQFTLKHEKKKVFIQL